MVCAKFRQNRSKIATERARTDRQTDRHTHTDPHAHTRTHTQTEMTQVILLSVPCYAIAMGQITRIRSVERGICPIAAQNVTFS